MAIGPVQKGLNEGKNARALARAMDAVGDSAVIEAIMKEHADEAAPKKVRNAAIKTVSILAQHRPSWVVGHLDDFIGRLDDEANIIRWTAMDVVGAVAVVDGESGPSHSIRRPVVHSLERALEDVSMVTASHAVENLARIAVARKRYRASIVAALLRVETFPREEACREVLLGKVVEALESIGPTGLSTSDRKQIEGLFNRLVASGPEGRAGKKATRALRRWAAA